MAKKRIVAVAMSGGTDSSYVALWCKRRGYEVLGLTLRLTEAPMTDAAAMAEQLGVAHTVIDARAAFQKSVVDCFAAEYARLRTPNPCAVCNPRMKFGLLLDFARQHGAQRLATGHYARVAQRGGRWRLLAGRDPHKEQSYFLFGLSQTQLAAALFPLGALTKDEVRARLKAANIAAPETESQETCFVPPGQGVADWLRQRGINTAPGPIVDRAGRELGRHNGLAGFTVGQREGIRVAAAHPLYVLGFDAARNALIVGKNEELLRREMRVRGLNLVALPAWPDRFRARVRVRYRATPAAAVITRAGDDELRVQFDQPQRGLTPGQAAVFYRRGVVLGGGWIDAAAD